MTKHKISNGKAGDIFLLEDVNARSNMRVKILRESERPSQLFNRMSVGDQAFMPGYTANDRDGDRRLKLIKMGSYTRNGQLVWSIRSTENNGVKGVMVYREA